MKNIVETTDVRIVLMVDIKSESKTTYKALDALLNEYQSILTEFENGKTIFRPVTVVVSGKRDIESLTTSQKRFAGLDGRVKDIGETAYNYPMISDNWRKHFTWNGEGDMPPEEFSKLKRMAKVCRKQGNLLRFWAIPEKEKDRRERIWAVLSAQGVLIGTDKVPELAGFLNYRVDQ
ncbi:PI-PLC domain-containing protein [Fulvitalea axinellae]|uniref:hypothetical protein n=1 Tax=Fulvitalea axinellae TaxID=1182444 RepID=UPI0030CA1D31